MLSWPILALIYSLTCYVITLASDIFKLKGLHFLFWMRLFAMLMLSPVLFFLPLPNNPVFYFALLGTVTCFGYYDLIVANLASKNGAPITSRLATTKI